MDWLETLLYPVSTLVGVALGHYLTTHGLIKAKEADFTFEMFKEVLDKVYSPLHANALKILSSHHITPDDSHRLKDIIDKNRGVILLCPEKIQELIDDLMDDLREERYENAKGQLEELHREIKKITAPFSMPTKSLSYPKQVIKELLEGAIYKLRGETDA